MTAPTGSGPVPDTVIDAGGIDAGGIDTGGTALRIRRAWPGRDGQLTFEALDRCGRVRAGVIDAGATRVAAYRSDPALPGLADGVDDGEGPRHEGSGHEGSGREGSVGDTTEVLVHRWRRRAVIRTRTAGGTTRYAKLLPPKKVARTAELSRLAHRLGAAADVDVPAVIGAHPDRVVFAELAGSSLHELGSDRRAWAAAWDLWARRWPSLVSREPDLRVGQLPVHNAAAEAQTLRTWVNHVMAFDALHSSGPSLADVAETVGAVLTDGPAGDAPVLSHRDLHDKQLFYSREHDRLGILDFDTISRAEPALDLANIAVHMRLRRDQGLLDEAAVDTALTAVRRAATELRVSASRLRAYEVSTRLRLACVYAFRPAWHGLAQRWANELTDDFVSAQRPW